MLHRLSILLLALSLCLSPLAAAAHMMRAAPQAAAMTMDHSMHGRQAVPCAHQGCDMAGMTCAAVCASLTALCPPAFCGQPVTFIPVLWAQPDTPPARSRSPAPAERPPKSSLL